jgi:hypothetical protein
MESRWQTVHGLRLASLTSHELPELARAIVAYERKRIAAQKGQLRDITYVRLFGDGIHVVVRGEDWDKILPYLKDGSFNPREVPDPQIVYLNEEVRFDPGSTETRDSALYNRVLGVLRALFPKTFPTSNL